MRWQFLESRYCNGLVGDACEKRFILFSARIGQLFQSGLSSRGRRFLENLGAWATKSIWPKGNLALPIVMAIFAHIRDLTVSCPHPERHQPRWGWRFLEMNDCALIAKQPGIDS
jgi:hypothetical protein